MPNIYCSFESLAIYYFTFTALHLPNKSKMSSKSLGLIIEPKAKFSLEITNWKNQISDGVLLAAFKSLFSDIFSAITLRALRKPEISNLPDKFSTN